MHFTAASICSTYYTIPFCLLNLCSVSFLGDSDTNQQSDCDESDDGCAPELCSSAASSYKCLIAIHAGKPKGGMKVALKVENDKVRRLSLSEQSLEKAAESLGTDLIR